MKVNCKHLYLSPSLCCMKCATYVANTEEYKYNTQSSIFVKNVAQDRLVRDLERQVSLGKVLLFLDIDETILHTSSYPPDAGDTLAPRSTDIMDFTAMHSDKDTAAYYERMGQVECFHFTLDGRRFWFQLRPGFPKFISQMRERLVIFLTTTGTKQYATYICNFLDPKAVLFYQMTSREGYLIQQVQSTTDENCAEYAKSIQMVSKSRLLRRNYVIFDDRSSVWDAPKPPRNFFRSIPFGAPLFSAADCFPMLPSAVRDSYVGPQVEFSSYDLDAQMDRLQHAICELQKGSQLEEQRRQVFTGCVFFFVLNPKKEVIRTGSGGNLERLQHRVGDAWKVDVRVQAVWDYGGTVHSEIGEDVTHVVSSQTLEFKGVGAYKVVSNDFLFHSCFMLQRAREEDFAP